MRIDAIPLSGTPGGDNGQIVLDIDEGAFLDLSENAISTQTNQFCQNSDISAKM